MSVYERTNDSFIKATGSYFLMKDSTQSWRDRSEAFETPFGFAVFARRLELCLRAASGVETQGREGFGSLISDLADTKNRYQNVRHKIKTESSDALRNLEIIDCGAGTGSILGFIEWVGLPYPRRLVLVEPNPEYFMHIRKRIETGNETGESSLTVLSKKVHDWHANPKAVVYEIEDVRDKGKSEIQVIHSTIEGTTSSIAQEPVITFVGISKYYSAADFKEMIEAARRNLTGNTSKQVVFNTQGVGEVLPGVSYLERGFYRMAKRLHQIVISGKPNLHHFYSRRDFESFGQEYKVIHNFGNGIVVSLT